MPNPGGGGIPCAAAKLGISGFTYRANVAAGLRWCWGCVDWQPVGDFGRDRSRSDGVARVCKAFHRARRAWDRKARKESGDGR